MATRHPESGYRRRVLAVGGAAAFVLFVVGAPIFNNRIENDLERRVPDELVAAGFDADITAKFSGQEGTLFCSGPLADPEGAIDAAYDVNGVHAIELDRSCRVLTVGGTVDTTDTSNDTADTTGSSDATTPATGSAGAAPSTVVEQNTVGGVLAADPQFSSFALLVDESEISVELNDLSAVPVTVFAATNEAFEDVPADLLATLRSDPEIRDRVLRSHMVTGSLTIDDLSTGSLTALDGTTLDVVNDNGVVTINGGTVSGGPFVTANGSVYSIDGVIVPEGLDTSAAPIVPAATDATFDAGAITLTGVVADEASHQRLVDTAVFGVGAENVVDLLTVDPATGVSAEQATQLSELIVALRVNLVSGSVGFDGTNFYASGRYATDTSRDAMLVAAEALGVAANLEQRPAVTDESAATLEADLNAFVAANPILFEPGSAVLAASAEPVLSRVAASLLELDAVATLVEGHTDSDGSAATNLSLSQDRAAAVVDALVARGVPADTVGSEGFGSDRPVLADGVEDKVASRRVEFRISVSS